MFSIFVRGIFSKLQTLLPGTQLIQPLFIIALKIVFVSLFLNPSKHPSKKRVFNHISWSNLKQYNHFKPWKNFNIRHETLSSFCVHDKACLSSAIPQFSTWIFNSKHRRRKIKKLSLLDANLWKLKAWIFHFSNNFSTRMFAFSIKRFIFNLFVPADEVFFLSRYFKISTFL